MYLEIVTPDKTLYSGEVELVQLPGSNGSFEILKNHAALVATLAEGRLKYIDTQKQVGYHNISGGVVEVVNDNVVVLTEKA